MLGTIKLVWGVSAIAAVASGAVLLTGPSRPTLCNEQGAVASRTPCQVERPTTIEGTANAPINPAVLARAIKLARPISPETLALASRFQGIVDMGNALGAPPIFCYDPNTSDESMQILWQLVPELNPALRYQFSDSSRWDPDNQGEPIVLTFSFVPDGLAVDGGTSELFSRLDAQFGSRALWMSRVQASFDRWAALTGTSYVKVTAPGVDWDDGASWGSGGGAQRGDVRISMIDIDGGSNVLAYNYFPNFGDMVLDRAEAWGSISANNHRFFRNVLMHEHGHGLGYNHVCPITAGANGRLMEPFLNTAFDGPTHDDIRGVHRGYGDAFEPNDTSGAATNVGNIIFGSPVVIGAVPAPAVTLGSTISIDSPSDQDWFQFSVIADSTISLTLTPLGYHYDSSPQSCPSQDGSCCFFNFVDSDLIFDLNIELIDSDGSTVIAAAAANGVGQTETMTDVPLPGSPGTYFIRVYAADVNTSTQLYSINASVITAGADITAPQPNPTGFESPPLPTSTTAISMTSLETTDATAPITYQFDFVSGGTGGGPDSAFQVSRTFTDTGLSPNRNYTYRVRSRDSAPPPGPNTGTYSPNVTGTTHIETPTGVAIGTVTATTVQMSATGVISFFDVDQSGLFFDSITAGGDDGINEWIQVNGDTAINLTPNTQYDFQARARNRNAIETVGFSPSASVVTLAAVPGAPILSNPGSTSMFLDPDAGTNPANTEMAIRCVSSSPADANWDGKYVDATGGPTAAEVWQDDTIWGNQMLTGMQPDTTYTFEVKARNSNSIETAFGATAAETTTSIGTCSIPGDVNNSGGLDALDIAGYVRVKMGTPDGGDVVSCADFGNGDIDLDTVEFVDLLLSQP